jgi:hypothetical protein
LSEIRATTISDAAGTGPIALTGQSAAKAFLLFNGTTNNIDVSLNTSSVTDLGTGYYQQNFASTYSATKAYAVSMCSNDLSWGAKQVESGGNGGILRTASYIRTGFFSGSGSTFNGSEAEMSSVTTHGDLA